MNLNFVSEPGMETPGVGDCAGLHHAMGALHGLALLNAEKLPQSLGPMLLRRAEQMWSLMLKDPHGMVNCFVKLCCSQLCRDWFRFRCDVCPHFEYLIYADSFST